MHGYYLVVVRYIRLENSVGLFDSEFWYSKLGKGIEISNKQQSKESKKDVVCFFILNMTEL